MKKATILLLLPILLTLTATVKVPEREYYQIRVYHLKNDAQVKRVESFLEKAFLPALHKMGIQKVGVFKPVEMDTADRKIFVLIPYPSLAEVPWIEDDVHHEKKFQTAGTDYIDVKHTDPAYERMEVILLQAFTHQSRMQTPALKGPREQRIYELRSYEGHSEKIFRNKVHMFNEGGEIALFKRLGFNAVFYGEVIAGCRMPNLMYMTTFENMESRDQHWRTFVADPEWKKMSSLPEYQNNVSKIDINLLRPTAYSDY